MSEAILGCHSWEGSFLLASREQRSGALLSTLSCTGQPPQRRVIWPQMSTLSAVGNPRLDGSSVRPEPLSVCGMLCVQHLAQSLACGRLH